MDYFETVPHNRHHLPRGLAFPLGEILDLRVTFAEANMALQVLSQSSIFNSFAVFREILQGISTFTTIFPGAHFEDNDRYFEDEPNVKSRSFVGYPIITMDTNVGDEHITYTGLRNINYTTVVTINTEYDVENTTPRLNRYMNAIIDYFHSNQTLLLNNYGIDGITITKTRDRDEIAERQLVVGILTFDYNVRMDVEN